MIAHAIETYKDKKTMIKMNMIKNIPLLKDSSAQSQLETVYRSKELFYEKGTTLIKEGQNCRKVIMIKKGQVDVIGYFEGNPFTIEKLFEGSIINYDNFMFDDLSLVDYICAENISTVEFDEKTLE